MAAGDLTASVPVIVNNTAALVKAEVDKLNLAATTDHLFILPIENSQRVMIFKVARAAS